MKPDQTLVVGQLLSYPESYESYPFGPQTAVYKVRAKGTKDDKMFALLSDKGGLLQLSLKCDPQLAELLRGQYESVMPGYHLNKRHWNTIVLSGQLPWVEVVDLIDHSWQLVLAANKL